MLALHHAAVKTRLQAHAGLAGKVDDSVRIKNGAEVAANYVALTVTLPEFEEMRLSAPQTPIGDQLLDVSIRVVAVDYGGLLLMMDAVNAQLLGHRLQVTGRAISPLARTAMFEPDYNRASGLHFMDVEFEATSSHT